jgi:cytochrome c-type biogenesis protein CcmE
MKKIHIIAIALIAVSIGILISAVGDVDTYSTFTDAARTGRKVKIVGQLAKDKEMVYNPEKDPNYFSFYLIDSNGDEQKVVLLQSKPQDFERSEQVVLTGKMKEDAFVATDLLMKCPSKYKDEEMYLREAKG